MSMTQRTVIGVALAMAVLYPAGGCRDKSRRTESVVGSTSIQPFAEELALAFNSRQSEIYVEVQGGGSTAGLQAVENGIADIGTCSRHLKEGENYGSLVIAYDGIAIVVNRVNLVKDLSLEQIRGIFEGAVTSWSEVGGLDVPIRLITREEGSGTREAFSELVMHGSRISNNALTQESNGAVKELVKNDPGAIGYMSLGLMGEDLKVVWVDGVEPSEPNVRSGKYPLKRPFLFAFKGSQPPPHAQKFIDFVLSDEGQNMLRDEGLLPVK